MASKGIDFKLEGKSLAQTLRRLNLAEEKVRKVVNAEFNSTANKIVSDAKRKAPVNFGQLRNSIRPKYIRPLVVEVEAAVQYAPFVEFGTKKKYKPVPRLQRYASQFKGRKGGGWAAFLSSITLWYKRKGITEPSLFLIIRSIAANGIKPQPYFFEGYFRHIRNVSNRLINRINRAGL